MKKIYAFNNLYKEFINIYNSIKLDYLVKFKEDFYMKYFDNIKVIKFIKMIYSR